MKKLIVFIILFIIPSLSSSERFINPIAQIFLGDFMELRGLKLENVQIKYLDYSIKYQYQSWKIKNNTICEEYRTNILEYSKCTQAAKTLFSDVCIFMKKNPKNEIRHQKMKDMYCKKALSYKPVVAMISKSNAELQSEINQAKNLCNTMIMRAMSSKNSYDFSKRDIVCSKYKKLKKQNNQ